MNLQPVAGQKGLWQNQNWTPGTPGTFVLLIGVSQYDFLPGGKGSPLAADPYGLGQLAVSAWTAYALFNWFRTQYQYSFAGPNNSLSPVPLAQCWLLLSPTSEEISRIDSSVNEHIISPTYEACEEAIYSWWRTMNDLSKAAAERSRCYFFFSGHGLEIHQKEQILLPCDYLDRPGRHNRALNINKIALAMTTMAVCEQFFFVDACRNDYDRLRALDIRGNDILTASLAHLTNPANNATILYATSSGMPAHQPTSPDNGYSLFGQALIDGLTGQQGVYLDCRQMPCSIQLAFLQRFVLERYRQLLTNYGWPGRQYVRQGGEPWDTFVTVTHIDQVSSDITLSSVIDLETDSFIERLTVQREPDKPQTGPLFRIERDRSKSFQSNLIQAGVNLYEVLGRESVTAFWNSTRLFSFRNKEWLPQQRLILHKVERTVRDYGYRLTFSIDKPQDGYWLEFSDGVTNYGIVLPVDSALWGMVKYRLDFTVLDDGQRPARITGVQVDLSMDNPEPANEVALLWEKYQTINAATAAEDIDMRFLQSVLQRKRFYPLAATVGAIILLRARRLDLAVGDWLFNLSDWFPHIPDGLVLRNMWLLLQNDSRSFFPEITGNLLELLERGLPFTGEALSLAMWQVETLLVTEDLIDHKEHLQQLENQLRTTIRFYRPGGLLAVFAGKPEDLSPQTLGYGK